MIVVVDQANVVTWTWVHRHRVVRGGWFQGSRGDSGVPFILNRRRFPVKQSYAITINKAQDQTLRKVGIYLPHRVVTHGQLYVAVSRARSFSGLKFMLTTKCTQDVPCYTDNIVYKSALKT